jgi:prepilin-type N-terminal cleavage/methylation domain-containing protein
MTGTRRSRGRRPGFTLIELLVVMGIIALLVSLGLAAAMKIITAGPRVETQSEIRKMEESLKLAQKEYNLEYLPSKLILYKDVVNYKTPSGTAQQQRLIRRSADVLNHMFPRLLKSGGSVNWDGTSRTPSSITLEGQQCLVFYLGGIPSTSGGNQCKGFANDPVNPANFTANTKPIGPFYQFKSNRLKLAQASDRLFSYQDPYGTPYAYFATAGSANKYEDDCPSLTTPANQFHPYKDPRASSDTFFNAGTFQIISAGPDKKFGSGGGSWDPTVGTSDEASKDNLTNFTKSPLLAPLN